MLLLELNRLLGAFAKYGPGHPGRENLLERGFLLWQLELERAGPIDLERSGRAFHHREFGTLDCLYLGDLNKAMEIHQLDQLRVTGDLDRDGFTRFVILLAIPTANLDQMCEGKFAGRLYASSGPGIEVNGRPRESAQAEETNETPAQEPPVFPGQSPFPTLEEDPFEAPAMGMQGERLRLSLRQLDRCDDNLLYDSLIDKILDWCAELYDAGQREEIYRALLILTDHAGADQRGERPRALMAQAALEQLVDRPQLEFLIARACDGEVAGVRPTQVLLQLGEGSTEALPDGLDGETDRARSERLSGTVLALGECAVPALIEALTRHTDSRQQLVVRLAGQLQSPKLVPILAHLFHASGPALRREAGLALASIGNLAACNVLVRGLERDHEQLSSISAQCLGAFRNDRTTEALLVALARARGQGRRDRSGHGERKERDRLALVIVRTLGQLGGQHKDVGPALASILALPSAADGRGDADLRELKCATLEVLGGHDGSEAQTLILSATRDDDPAVSRKAHEIMNQRDRAQSN